MQKNARTQPDGFTSWVRENITADWLMSFILNYSGETDLAVYQAADFLPAYRQCMTEAFSQGNEGYTQDLLIAMQEWGFTPEQITCPVSLWYGEKDTSTVHSRMAAKSWRDAFPARSIICLRKKVAPCSGHSHRRYYRHWPAHNKKPALRRFFIIYSLCYCGFRSCAMPLCMVCQIVPLSLP